MKTLVSLLVMSAALLLTAKGFPVAPIHPDAGTTDTSQTTTAPNPERNISLSRYTAMVHRLVGAMQTIWIIVKENVRHCIANCGKTSLIQSLFPKESYVRLMK